MIKVQASCGTKGDLSTGECEVELVLGGKIFILIIHAMMLKKMVKAGFSAAVYTQTTDVEGEVNGFMTYDRKVDKMNISKVKKVNQEVISALQN